MASYTELIIFCELKKDTPNEVIETLVYMGESLKPMDYSPRLLFWHEDESLDSSIVGCDCVLSSGDAYFGKPMFNLKKCKFTESYHLFCKSNTPNRGEGVEKVLAWLKPYIENGSGIGGLYAIVTEEYEREPTLYYLKEGNNDEN